MAAPPVAFVAAWIGGFSGGSKQETERRLAAVEDDSWNGPLPAGISSLAFGAPWPAPCCCTTTWAELFAPPAARRALELAGWRPSPFFWMAQAALGHALYLSGQPTEARPRLEELIARVSAAEQPYAVLAALAEAEEQLGRALDLLRIDGMLVQRAWALLLVGSVRHARGDVQCPPARSDPSGVTIDP